MKRRSEKGIGLAISTLLIVNSLVFPPQNLLKGWSLSKEVFAQRNERGARFQPYKPPPKARCDQYKQQFDRKRKTLDSEDSQVKQAIQYRTLGEAYCNTGHSQAGQKVLRRALQLIGQRPSNRQE